MSGEPVSPINVGVYPDLAEHGGLGPAWRNAARGAGIDIDITSPGHSDFFRLKYATVETPRGAIKLSAVYGERVFGVKIRVENDLWASGLTDDLEQAARVAVAWRDGSTIRELVEAFPFMKTNRIAQALEDGNLREVLWSMHLEDEGYELMRPVLRAAHDDPRLSGLYPSVTHETLARFTVDHRDRENGQIAIYYFPSHYEVLSSWEENRVHSAATPDEAVRLASSLIPDTY